MRKASRHTDLISKSRCLYRNSCQIRYYPYIVVYSFRLQILIDSIHGIGKTCHETGTAVTVEGPRFSSKAESKVFQLYGGSIINMTTVPEVGAIGPSAISTLPPVYSGHDSGRLEHHLGRCHEISTANRSLSTVSGCEDGRHGVVSHRIFKVLLKENQRYQIASQWKQTVQSWNCFVKDDSFQVRCNSLSLLVLRVSMHERFGMIL